MTKYVFQSILDKEKKVLKLMIFLHNNTVNMVIGNRIRMSRSNRFYVHTDLVQANYIQGLNNVFTTSQLDIFPGRNPKSVNTLIYEKLDSNGKVLVPKRMFEGSDLGTLLLKIPYYDIIYNFQFSRFILIQNGNIMNVHHIFVDNEEVVKKKYELQDKLKKTSNSTEISKLQYDLDVQNQRGNFILFDLNSFGLSVSFYNVAEERASQQICKSEV